jgi:hypothetical protein
MVFTGRSKKFPYGIKTNLATPGPFQSCRNIPSSVIGINPIKACPETSACMSS